MNILILGAGRVGGTIAEYLASDGNNVTVVDNNAAKLDSLRKRLDIHTIEGYATHPQVLEQAGIADADILIAVTISDEVNMMACQIAYSLFKTPKKIARIRSAGYTNQETQKQIFKNEHIPVDVIITPEQLVTDHIHRLIKQPGALQIIDFANGDIQLVAIRATSESPMLNHELRDLKTHMPNIDCRVAAIYRGGNPIMPDADTVIHVNDEVFVLAETKSIPAVINEMANVEKSYRKIIIAGGGNVGLRLASILEKENYQIKIIETDLERCHYLSNQLQSTIVLHGEASDQNLLREENIENTDVFLALTNDDEDNIIASMLAKNLGAGKVITIINNHAYAELMQGSVIDITVSPQQITNSALLAYVRRADTVKACALRRNAAEAMEMIVHGDQTNSKLSGKRIRDVKLPEGAGFGALLRKKNNEQLIIMGHSNTIIEENDHMVVFTIDRNNLKQIERLFQVNMSFF